MPIIGSRAGFGHLVRPVNQLRIGTAATLEGRLSMDSSPATDAPTNLRLIARPQADLKRYTDMLEWIESRPASHHQDGLRRKYKQLVERTKRRLRQEEHFNLRNTL